MNILMATNTFTPHVGGVARSVQGFADEDRRRGHRVLVLAPSFEGTPEHEEGVLRFPALRHFSGNNFSIPMPAPGRVRAALRDFHPDVVHSHHPFLLGDTALRVSAALSIPVVFTHHTMYEEYTHYVPGDSERLKHFTIELVTGYCNLCDAVIAPSATVAALLPHRGIRSRIVVIPTGIDVARFVAGNGASFRRAHGVPRDAFVVGHVGRLAPEKNLGVLARAVTRFLISHTEAHCVIAGAGPSREEIEAIFEENGLTARLHMAGLLVEPELMDAYASMNAFAFTSQSETQGMVLTEAMAAGVPVVAVDASGAREVVIDGVNGRLLPREDLDEFAAALAWIADLGDDERARMSREVAKTASDFSIERSADRTLDLYRSLIEEGAGVGRRELGAWAVTRRRINEEMRILSNIAHAATDSILAHEPPGPR